MAALGDLVSANGFRSYTLNRYGIPQVSLTLPRGCARSRSEYAQRLLVARSRDEVALPPPSYLAWFEQPQNVQILFQMLPGKICCRSIVER